MLKSLLPSPPPWTPARGLEIGRGGLGALVGLLVTGIVARAMIGGAPLTSLLLVAPIGASAVLVFAVPASPLAQPHSVVLGNMLSALVGVACAHLLHNPLIAGPLAVGLAIALMSLTGCLHPPGGAVALICGLAGPEVARQGWLFALTPVGLDSLLLVVAGLAYHRLTGHSYPHRAPAAAASPHKTADVPPGARVGFTSGDLDAALAHYDELLDVSRDDLDALFRQIELQAHQRLHAQILCGDIMSVDVVTVDAEQPCGDAMRVLLVHDLRVAPVIDAGRKVLGLARRAELQAAGDDKVEAVIDPLVHRVRETTPIQALLPLLSSGAAHEAVVVDAGGVLKGVVTQTDLLAVLYRAHVVEAMASQK